MRTFRNLEGQDITEEQVLEEVKALFGEDHDADELGTIFTNYVNNAINNGTLTEITNENKNIKNEKENRTMKTYDEKVEAIKNIIEDMDDSDAVALHNEYCYETNDYDDEIIEMERFDEICEGMTPACYDERQNNEGSVKYTWKDIVLINGKCYAEEFEISGLMDGDDVYQIDSFLEAVAEKYGVDVDDVQTYMMNDIHFDPKNLPWGAAECGCYIDGKAEWL